MKTTSFGHKASLHVFIRVAVPCAVLFGLLTNTAAQLVHRMSRIDLTSNRAAQLTLTGGVVSAFASYYDLYPLETSTDMASWTPLATLLRTNSSAAPLRFLDNEAGSLAQRFYRTPTNHLNTAFPKPTGPYAVGTTFRQLSDPARTNRLPYLMQLWYPARPQAGVLPAAYIDRRIAGDWAGFGDLPATVVASAYAHAQPDVPVATNEMAFPILIYSHGGGQVQGDNTHSQENLASHGFVVVGTQHTYGMGNVLPDGQVYFNFHPEPGLACVSDAVRDAQFAMDELERMNADDALFVGRLDVARIGAFGYSYGGGVVIELCATEPRCRAAVTLDGVLHSHLLDLGFDKPFLMLTATVGETFLDPHRNRMRAFFDKFVAPGAYWVRINGSAHRDFDSGNWFRSPGNTRFRVVIRDYLRSFFKKHLRGENDHLLDGPSAAYPEANPFLRSELTILSQPQSKNIRHGSNDVLTIFATGANPIRYQWQFNGADIPGATATNLNIVNAQSNHVGTYTVLLEDGVSTAASQTALVDVGDPPTIVQGLTNQIAAVGNTVTFTVTVTGTPPFGYEWRKGTPTVASNTLSEATASFTIPSVSTTDAGTWRVIVRNKFNQTTSVNSAAILTVQ